MTDYERYADYLKMLRRPFQKLCRLRFLQPDGSTAFMLDNQRNGNRDSTAFIAQGNINYNWQNGRRTNASVTIDNVDGAYDYNFNTIWFGQQIALDEGLILSDGSEFYIQQGIFLIETPTENVKPAERTVTYNLVDKVAALDGSLGGNLESTYQVDRGNNLFDPIVALLQEDKYTGSQYDPDHPFPKERMIDSVPPVFTDYYNGRTYDLPDEPGVTMTDIPYTLTVDGGNTRWDVIESLVGMVNGWVGYDKSGALRVDPSQDDIEDDDKPIQWEFSMDEATLLGMAYTVKNTEVYNDYIVIGDMLSEYEQPSGRATLTDPRSPCNVNAIGLKTIRVEMPGFGSNTQCHDYAWWMVKRSSVLQRAVRVSCSQMFHIDGNEIVTITRTDKPGNPVEKHLIQGYSRPLASNGEMEITATSLWDIPVPDPEEQQRSVKNVKKEIDKGNNERTADGDDSEKRIKVVEDEERDKESVCDEQR